jgi:hypothetical protein
MRSRSVIAAATGATVVLASALFAGSGGAQAPGSRTLTFTEGQRGSTFKLVDNPPRSPGRTERTFRLSAGDFFVFTNPLCVWAFIGEGPSLQSALAGILIVITLAVHSIVSLREAKGSRGPPPSASAA